MNKPMTSTDDLLYDLMSILGATELDRRNHYRDNPKKAMQLKLLLKHIQEAERLARLEGRISGLKSAHRYKGNGFEVGEKIRKEIDKLSALSSEADRNEFPDDDNLWDSESR